VIVGAPERSISASTTMFSGTEKIVNAAWKIIPVPEKTVSLANLILDAAQMAGSGSLEIADEPEMIVLMKGKTTGAETGNRKGL